MRIWCDEIFKLFFSLPVLHFFVFAPFCNSCDEMPAFCVSEDNLAFLS